MRRIYNYVYRVPSFSEMAVPAENNSPRSKAEALLAEGTLNPAPEKVRRPQVPGQNEFFDPRDLVQVKYEMLRRVSVENGPVTEATEDYGVSRPTYYQAQAHFAEAGIAGLVPKKRGPRGPHKLQGEVLTVCREARSRRASRSERAQLAALIRQKFDLESSSAGRSNERWA